MCNETPIRTTTKRGAGNPKIRVRLDDLVEIRSYRDQGTDAEMVAHVVHLARMAMVVREQLESERDVLGRARLEIDALEESVRTWQQAAQAASAAHVETLARLDQAQQAEQEARARETVAMLDSERYHRILTDVRAQRKTAEADRQAVARQLAAVTAERDQLVRVCDWRGYAAVVSAGSALGVFVMFLWAVL